MIRILPGLAGLAESYDAFILDLWGVLHDGVQAYPEARDCLLELKARGKKLQVLSNAPRRAHEVQARNRQLGLDDALFDAVVSSGEATWQALARRNDAWCRRLGRRCYHLGPPRDLGMRDGLDYDFVDSLGCADFVLNTGALESEDTIDDYRDFLAESLARGLPMVCANPDLIVMRGDEWELCAGAIAQAYEEMGGQVRAFGKPHPEVYETCLAAPGFENRDRVLAVGDSLRTDVAGAARAGIDSLFITGGIHDEELPKGPDGKVAPDRLEAVCRQANLHPTAALDRLRW